MDQAKLPKLSQPPTGAGRPRVGGEEFLPKLLAAFQNLMTDEEACQYAGISTRTFYRRMAEKGEFWQKITEAKSYLILKAKCRIVQILVSGSDRVAGPMARWYLEKAEPEIYGKKPRPLYPQSNYNFMSDEEFMEQVKREGGPQSAQEVIDALEAKRMARAGVPGDIT